MQKTPGDDECMFQLAARNQEALRPLFRRYAPLVYHLASQSLEAGSAEDIVQDVFLTVWRKAAAFEPGRGSFRSWLLQITHFRILNELRRRSRRPQRPQPRPRQRLRHAPPPVGVASPTSPIWRRVGLRKETGGG